MTQTLQSSHHVRAGMHCEDAMRPRNKATVQPPMAARVYRYLIHWQPHGGHGSWPHHDNVFLPLVLFHCCFSPLLYANNTNKACPCMFYCRRKREGVNAAHFVIPALPSATKMQLHGQNITQKYRCLCCVLRRNGADKFRDSCTILQYAVV